MRHLSLVLPIALATCGGAPPTPAPAEPSQAVEGFWDHWGDSQAELAGYDLTIPRYGELRTGRATLIAVTEDFTRAQRVKTNGGHDDEYPVIKLNDVRDFQTGIYDYNAMTSTFVPLDGSVARGLPTKASLTVQEWCGHVYEHLIVDPGRYQRVRHSYFDGEADLQTSEDIPEGGVFGDAMPMLVRGVVGALVEPGGSREVPYLRTMLEARFDHRPLEWQTATLTRGAAPETVQTPAGTFEAERYTVTAGVTSTWWVEAAPPHRLVKWAKSTGEEAVLTGSMRTPYWKQHGEGDEAALTALDAPTP